MRNYLVPGLGDRRIDRLRLTDVERWLNGLATQCECWAQGKVAAGRPRSRDGEVCAVGRCCHAFPLPRTIKDLGAVRRSALSAAMREELVEKNVASLVTLPRQRRRTVVPWTSEEARRFLESAAEDDDPFYAWVRPRPGSRMRKGEVLGMTWPAWTSTPARSLSTTSCRGCVASCCSGDQDRRLRRLPTDA